MIALLACADTPLLDSVEAELASQGVAEAEPATRLFTAIAGVIAETFAVESVDGHVFEGGGAQALGIGSAQVTTGNDDLAWDFSGVGLDGAEGALLIATDLERASFAVEYEVAGMIFAATMTRAYDGAASSVVGGSGTHSVDGVGRDISALGPAPYNGLYFAVPPEVAPTQGQLHWSYDEDGEDGNEQPDLTLTTLDATEIDVEAGTWPTTLAGRGWDREVELRLP